MTPRNTYLMLAAVAVAALAGGVAALRYLPGLDGKRIAATQIARIAGTGALLPGLRGRHAAAPSVAAPQTEQRAAIAPDAPLTQVAPPAQVTPPAQVASPADIAAAADVARPAEVAALPPGGGAPEGVEGAVSFPAAPPTPPARPADLGKTTPLPPARPADLAQLSAAENPQAADAAQTLQDQQQPAEQAQAAPAFVNLPLPPTKPPELASRTPEAAQPAQAAPAAAPTQVARAVEPALRPAPDDAFQRQAPIRFGMGDQVFVRIFKQEGQLELWLRKSGRFSLYKTFPVCKWSGRLGPKVKEADYQSPEGFYSVSARQLHPHSNYHRAFNVGYPNAFDRQNGRTGGLVMVHGACKSVGCFAMTDRGIEEIYAFVEAALRAGQQEVPVHIFPFRMTDQAIARETGGGWLAFVAGGGNYAHWNGFWRNLKEGYDIFEQTGEPPVAFACGDHYAFGGGGASCRRIAGW